MPVLDDALQACPIARTAVGLGDPWTLLVLRQAAFGTTRFSDFRARLHAARDVLSDRLQSLVDAGLLERSAYREAGSRPRDEYRLTAAGREFQLVLGALGEWGDAHLPIGRPVRASFSDGSGRPVRVAFVDADGREVPPGDVTARVAGAPAAP